MPNLEETIKRDWKSYTASEQKLATFFLNHLSRAAVRDRRLDQQAGERQPDDGGPLHPQARLCRPARHQG